MKKYFYLESDSLKKLGVKNYKELWKLVKKQGYKGLQCTLGIKPKSIDEKNNSIDFVMSDNKEDRHGDIVHQNWDFKPFKKNPVFLNSHRYDDLTEIIGRVTKIETDEKGNKTEAKVKFAVDENPKAKIAFDLYAGKFANAVSPGFIPKEFNDKGEILLSELIELSGVSVPANARALAKSYGIDVDKLYESTNPSNPKNKKGDGKASRKSNSGKANGKKNRKKTKSNKGGKVSKKEFENWDDRGEEIRCKVRDIAEFESGTFEKILLVPDIPRIKAVIGVLTGDKSDKKNIQSLFFPKEDGWSLDDAKKWLTVRQFQSLHGRVGKMYPKKAGKKENVIKKEADKKDIVSKIENVIKKEAERHKDNLLKIRDAINSFGESKRVETRPEDVRAENNKVINRVVRNLLKLKEKGNA